MPQKFNVKNRLRSFSFAINGVILFFRNEHQARVHALIAAVVVVLGFVLELSYFEWIAIILSIGLVLVSEMLNTSIESICDFMHPEINPRIKTIKDLSAGGVLLAALTALVIGLVIFGPKVLDLFSSAS